MKKCSLLFANFRLISRDDYRAIARMESAVEAPHYGGSSARFVVFQRWDLRLRALLSRPSDSVLVGTWEIPGGVTYHSVTVLIRITEFRLVGVARPRRSCAGGDMRGRNIYLSFLAEDAEF